MNKPGIKSESFYIKVNEHWFQKGVILDFDREHKCIVVKVYNSWWRKALWKLRIPIKYKILKLKLI